MNDDTHVELVKAYLEYFKWNEEFHRKPSEMKRREARRWLSRIMVLAKDRRLEIITAHREQVAEKKSRMRTKKAKRQ
jgi:hypothetical protein